MIAFGTQLGLPIAASLVYGGRCSELPTLQSCLLSKAKQPRRSQGATTVMVAAQQATSPQLRIFRGEDLKGSQMQQVMARPRIDFESILHTVAYILALLEASRS